MNQKRTPAGVPTGGEFAANQHDEADADLATSQGSSFPEGFPETGTTNEKVMWAAANNATVTVDMDMGEIDLIPEDLESEWDSIAPGEGFEIVAARIDPNPYGASDDARAVADAAGEAFRSGDYDKANSIIRPWARSEDQSRVNDYYSALANPAPLTEDKQALVKEALERHGITREELDRSIDNEFGMLIPYQDGNGIDRTFREHPSRIVNRIDAGYLNEVASDAAYTKEHGE